MNFQNCYLVKNWLLWWTGSFFNTYPPPSHPSLHGRNILSSIRVGLGHVTYFGQWNVDRSSRVPSKPRPLGPSCVSACPSGSIHLLLWEKHAPGTQRASCSGAQNGTHGEHLSLTHRPQHSGLCQSADPWARNKCLLLYAREIFGLYVMQQKHTNPRKSLVS